MYPKSLEQLIECFKMLPGVGDKTAERYALLMLEKSDDEVDAFAQALLDARHKIHPCPICGNITEEEVCGICSDKSRDQTLLCVVQSPKDVLAMEKTQGYSGLYHVLGGLISPSKGILPEDLGLDVLQKRVGNGVKEVILATNPTVDGETTALYLDHLLAPTGVLVTRLAHGLPMGGHLDYADELTLVKAFEGRKKMV